MGVMMAPICPRSGETKRRSSSGGYRCRSVSLFCFAVCPEPVASVFGTRTRKDPWMLSISFVLFASGMQDEHQQLPHICAFHASQLEHALHMSLQDRTSSDKRALNRANIAQRTHLSLWEFWALGRTDHTVRLLQEQESKIECWVILLPFFAATRGKSVHVLLLLLERAAGGVCDHHAWKSFRHHRWLEVLRGSPVAS